MFNWLYSSSPLSLCALENDENGFLERDCNNMHKPYHSVSLNSRANNCFLYDTKGFSKLYIAYKSIEKMRGMNFKSYLDA